MDGMSADEAMTVMRRFVPEHAGTLRYQTRLIDSDQWTLQGVIRNIVLSLGGIAISVTSALPAWRRLVRGSRAVGVGTRRVDDHPRQTAAAVASEHER